MTRRQLQALEVLRAIVNKCQDGAALGLSVGCPLDARTFKDYMDKAKEELNALRAVCVD